MKTHSHNYKHIIKDEFTARKERNPSYSLRAFAKSLDVSPAMISQLINGKRQITKKSALLIADRLKLSSSLRTKFMISAIGEEAALRELGIQPYNPRELEVERFHMIADWYHYAILALTDIPDHELSPAWIAKRLKISPGEAKEALERLQLLGLITQDDGSDTPATRVQSKVPNAAIQMYHKQNLQKASDSLSQEPPEMRDFSAITLALDPHKVEDARALIHKFRRDMYEFLDSGKNNKRVYTLSVQLFPVSL